MNEILPFALPDIGIEEIEEVKKTLESGWLTSGPKTEEFENKFAAYFKNHEKENLHAIAVNSATAGLHLALEACGIGKNDEVIIPDLTFTATAEVVRYLGAHPVFVDSDPEDLNLSIEEVKKKVTKKTRAIIPIHFGGKAADMESLMEVCKKKRIHIVEDAAHALPTKYGSKLIGQLDTSATVFSFYATKTITSGEGGMVLTRNTRMAKRMRIMRLHGISRDIYARDKSNNGINNSWYYEVVAPGFKYNLSDVLSAIGIIQLQKMEKMWQRRKDIAKFYFQNLEGLPLDLPPKDLSSSSWYLFVARLNSKKTKIIRDEFIHKLKSLGIGASVHFIPLHMQPFWKKKYSLRAVDFPVCHKEYKCIVSLPIFSRMSDGDAERVVKAIKKIL